MLCSLLCSSQPHPLLAAGHWSAYTGLCFIICKAGIIISTHLVQLWEFSVLAVQEPEVSTHGIT